MDMPDPRWLPISLPSGVKAAVRTARGLRLDDHGVERAYWRVRGPRPARAQLWLGWATREEAVQCAKVALRSSRFNRAAAPRTVGELSGLWLFEQEGRSSIADSTKRMYRNRLEHLLAWLTEVELEALSPSVLERYARDRYAEQCADKPRSRRTRSPRTVAAELNILAMMWRWARERGWTPERQFPRIRVPVDDRAHVNNHHTPTKDDVVAALDTMRGAERLIVRLLAVTGARVSEIADLTVDQVDLVAGELAIDGKTGRRRVPLPGSDVKALREVLEGRPESDDPRVFLWADGRHGAGFIRHNRQRVQAALRGACAAADVERFTPHGLRRYVVRRLLRGGVDIGTAAAMMGHSPMVMLKMYDEVSAEDRRRALGQARLGELDSVATKVVQGPWNTLLRGPGAD